MHCAEVHAVLPVFFCPASKIYDLEVGSPRLMTRKIACFTAVFFSGFAMFAQAPAATGTSAAATATTTASTEVQQFQKIEDKWSDAVNNRDQYALELVLSPMFVGISASGDVTTRNQQLADVISEPDKTMHIDQ